jgi:sugar/nucleoside kinase (ribokinase family)
MPSHRFAVDVCGFGSINVDYLVAGPTGDPYFDELGEGKERAVLDPDVLKDHIKELEERPNLYIGGSSVNAIRALRALDPRLRTSLVGPLGHLPEGVTLDELDGIDLSGLCPYDGDANACVSVVEDAERKLHPYNDPAGVHKLLVVKRDQTVAALSRARLVHVTSLLAPDAGKLVGEILADVRAATNGTTQISVDLGQPWAEDRTAARAILPHARILLISDDELRALVPGLPSPLERDDERKAVDQLLKRYGCAPETIAILKRRAQPEDPTKSEQDARPRVGGVMYSRLPDEVELLRDEVLRDGLDKRQIIDSTGAGDFFAAAVLAEAASPHARAVQTLTLGTAMARHKFGHTPETAYDDVEQLLYGDTVPPAAGKVFVSHSHADADMVNVLLDTFAPGDGDRARAFFCTSQPDTTMPYGVALDPEVLKNLRAASVALFVVTEASVSSPACQREMGAAQVLRIPTVPLMHPTFPDWGDMKIPINFHKGVRLRCDQELRGVRDDLAKRFGWPEPSPADWQAAMARLHAALDERRGASATKPA